MTAGEGIKTGAEATKNDTDRAVDAVEAKVNEVTDTVADALNTAGEKIHAAAGKPSKEQM